MKKKMNKKKVTLLLLMTGILAASLTACQIKKDDSDKTEIKGDSKATEITEDSKATEITEDSKAVGESTDDYLSGSYENVASYYKQVLNSSLPFINTDKGGEEVYLDEFAYENEYTEDPMQYNINKFAYLDMDEDGENEVVLEMDYSIDGAYEVLKEIDGTVYGYNFVYRAMVPLYDDGSMMRSGGAADNEIYRMYFTATGYTEEVLDSTGTSGSTKTQATWYDFTPKNIDKILGGSSQSASQSGSQNASQGTSQSASLGGLQKINQKTSGNVFFNSDMEYLVEDELAYIPTEILRIARNEIYARHGYQFTSDLKTFFENKSWYSGTVSASDWSDSKLNTYEKKNVELIKKYESLGAKVPFTTSSVTGGTQINGDGFTLTLPSAWNSSNYFATKVRGEDCDFYTFYAKNNFAYGYGGVVFSLLVYDKPMPQDERNFYDGLVDLGNDGSHYFYMGQCTDVQNAFDISALQSEYMQLNDTYSEIVDSFEM